MANLEYLARIVANTSSFRTGMERARNAVDQLTTSVKRSDRDLASAARKLDDYGSKAQRVGGIMSATVTPAVTAAAAYSINAAADLGEAVSKNSVVFGTHANRVEEWASTAAESFGLSKRGALDAAGSFGAMLDAMGFASGQASEMSTELVGLAGDLASFHNADPTDMLDRLRSGLSGEVEPLRRFGVNISAAAVETQALAMGLGNASGELTEAEKVQARYALILEQTTTAQGDFARTADSLPNQMRSARAELEDTAAALGEQLLPYAVEGIEVIRGLVDSFSELSDGQQRVVITLAGIAAAAGPALVAFGSIARGAGSTIKALKALRDAYVASAASSGTFATAAAGVAAPVAVGVAGLAAGVSIVGAFRKALDEDVSAASLVQGIDDLVESGRVLDRDFGAFLDRFAADVTLLRFPDPNAEAWMGALDALTFGLGGFDTVADDLRGELAELDQVLADVANSGAEDALESAALGLARVAEEAGVTGAEWGPFLNELPEVAEAFDRAGLSVDVYAAALMQGQTPAEALATAQERAAQQAGAHADGLEDVAGAAAEAEAETVSLTDAIAELIAEQRAAVDPMFAAVKATQDYDEAVAAAAEARKALADGEGTEAELEAATIAVAEAALELDGALAEVDTSGSSARAVLEDLAERGLITSDQLGTLTSSLNTTRDAAEELQGHYAVEVDLDDDRALDGLSNVEKRLAELTGRRYTITVDTYTPSIDKATSNASSGSSGSASTGSSSGSNPTVPSKYAAFGGYQTAGRPVNVGERGPEVFVPSTAGTILSARELAAIGPRPAAAAGPSTSVHFAPTVHVRQETGNPHRDADVSLRKLAASMF